MYIQCWSHTLKKISLVWWLLLSDLGCLLKPSQAWLFSQVPCNSHTPFPQVLWTAYCWFFWRMFWCSDQFMMWSDSAGSIVIFNAKICCRLMSYLHKCPGCWDDAATAMHDFARLLGNCQLTNKHDAVKVFEATVKHGMSRGLWSI